jgi:C4-dicarboxylate-specific signal transduction histidine kinase
MNANNPETWVIAAVLVLALIAIAFLIARERKRRQSRRLQERFGPEYGRVVAQRGDRTKAESELKAREQRVERLTIVALAPADAAKLARPGARCKAASSTIPRALSWMRTGWSAT